MISAADLARTMLALAAVASAQQPEQRAAELIDLLRRGTEDPATRLIELGKTSEEAARAVIDGLAAALPDRIPGEAWPVAIRVSGNLAPYSGEGGLQKVAREIFNVIERRLDFVEAGTRRAVLEEVLRTRDLLLVDRRMTTEQLIENLEHRSSYVRELSAELLGERGAVSALPALQKALSAGHPGVEALEEILLTPGLQLKTHTVPHDLEVRISVARAILVIGTGEELSGPAHAILFSHGNQEERRAAIQAIVHLGPDGLVSVDTLVEALELDDPVVVREAITALGMFGPAAQKAARRLERLTSHEDPQIAERARAALRQIRGWG